MSQRKEGFMKKIPKKKRKVTELYFNEYDGTAEIYTYNTKLKKRLTAYAATYPDLCQLTKDDENGGLRFEIDKHRIGIRLTAPYSQERKTAASLISVYNSVDFIGKTPVIDIFIVIIHTGISEYSCAGSAVTCEAFVKYGIKICNFSVFQIDIFIHFYERIQLLISLNIPGKA